MNSINKIKIITSKLSFKEKIKILYLISISPIVPIFEVGLVFILTAIISSLAGSESKLTEYFKVKFNLGEEELIVGAIIISLVLVFTTAILKLLIMRITYSISFGGGSKFSVLLYEKTLKRSYEEVKKTNTSEFLNALTTKVHGLIHGYIISSINICVSLISLTTLMAGLLYLDFKNALLIFASLIASYVLIGYKYRQELKINGEKIKNGSENIYRSGSEGLGFIRDIKLNDAYNHFIEKFKNSDEIFRKAQARNVWLSAAPRVVMEAAIIVIIIVASIIKYQYDDGVNTLSNMVGLIFGFQKLIPYIQNIYHSWSQINTWNTSTEEVLRSIAEDSLENDTEKLTSIADIFRNRIEISELNYKYEGSKDPIIHNVNLTINKGDYIAITGKTGNGKSTLVDLITALRKPVTGSIKIDDILLDEINVRNYYKIISYVPQKIYMLEGTILENILGKKLIDKNHNVNIKEVQAMAKLTEIDSEINKFELKYQTNIGENGSRLSGGQIQRVAIARSLIKKDIKILILDEATSGLDSETEKKVINNIRATFKDLTVIIVTHNLSILSLCNKEWNIVDGQVLETINV